MAQNPQTAVAVIEQTPDAVVEWNLDNWPVDKFNRLIPTQTLGLATEFIRPLIVTVQLDVETDTYSSHDLPNGHRAPNAKGLAKLADAAGVNFVDEVRLDDGSNPNRAYVRVYAEMIDATGMKRRAPGSRDYILDSLPMTDAQRKRAKGYVHEHAATRAKHRALRALLSLAQSYPIADLQKPFAVARYVPNTQHPEIREAYKAAMVGAITALYGPEPAKELAAGPSVVEVAEVPDEAPRELGAGAPADADPAATQDDDLPEFLRPGTAAPAATTSSEPDLATLIRDSAEASGIKGDVSEAQLVSLREIFVGLGGKVTSAGLQVLWSDLNERLDLTGARAQAILNVAKSRNGAFADEWRAMAGIEAAA